MKKKMKPKMKGEKASESAAMMAKHAKGKPMREGKKKGY